MLLARFMGFFIGFRREEGKDLDLEYIAWKTAKKCLPSGHLVTFGANYRTDEIEATLLEVSGLGVIIIESNLKEDSANYGRVRLIGFAEDNEIYKRLKERLLDRASQYTPNLEIDPLDTLGD